MKTVTWTLLSCPDHQQRNGAIKPGTPNEVFAARNGCTACRITLACTACTWTSRHALWASALASQRNHEDAECRN